MKIGRGSQYYGSNISFIDMLFNIIMLFVLLFFAAIMLINPDTKKNDIEAKAEMIITMSWPDNSPHDIDLWVNPPDKSPIGYSHSGNTYLFLERDDLGSSNNFIIKDGKRVQIPTRREVMTFRGLPDGRFVVNVFFYSAKSSATGKTDSFDEKNPLPIVVEMIQINPKYKVMIRKEVRLARIKEEATAFSFIIKDGEITDIDTSTDEKFVLQAHGY